jgi:hypothetical protein
MFTDFFPRDLCDQCEEIENDELSYDASKSAQIAEHGTYNPTNGKA